MKPRLMCPLLVGIFAILSTGKLTNAQIIKPHTQFRVKLTAPLSTQTNKAGDKITAEVTTPQEFTGAFLEGQVRQAEGGGKLKGKSVLNFSFNRLMYGGAALPVSADVKGFFNSRGQQDVDEEGQIIKKTNNLGKVAATSALGALVGGLSGGGKGAAIGAGIGAAASIVFVQVATSGPSVSFAPGSEFILDVTEARQGDSGAK